MPQMQHEKREGALAEIGPNWRGFDVVDSRERSGDQLRATRMPARARRSHTIPSFLSALSL